MRTRKTPSSSRRDASDRAALWLTLSAGLLWMLIAAVSRGESEATDRRTDRFSATLSAGSTLQIENIFGDLVAASGPQFSATVTITTTAATAQRAHDLLRSTSVSQSRYADVYELRTRWPESHRRGGLRCRDCKIAARYELTIPPGVRAVLHTVNGEVRAQDLDGDIQLQSVNGDIVVREARHEVTAHTVNGRVVVGDAALAASSSLDLKTVNGAVLLTLPRDARFDLEASSMNGVISSTFPFPAQAQTEESSSREGGVPTPVRRIRTPRRVVVEKDDEENVVDLRDLEKEIEESMREADGQLRESMRGLHREMGHLKFMMPGSQYTGSIGEGGANVHLSTLNGSITVLAAGTRESQARTLASPRRSFTIEVPRISVPARAGPAAPAIPEVPAGVPAPRAIISVAPVPAPRAIISVAPMLAHGDEVIRGDVAGDFLATVRGGSYRIGNVSGRVKILTEAGEIHVASAGAGAELTTYGGDIRIGPVHGDLTARTSAGDVRATAVSGSAVIRTSGGDIRIDRVDGSADAQTGGGDIVLGSVAGGVRARTGGGEVRIALVSREPRAGVSVHSEGGDVTLTLPSDVRADVELSVEGGGDSDETYIRSDFPEIAVSRRSDSAGGVGVLNGGGARVTVRTSSGTIRLRKGPPAGS